MNTLILLDVDGIHLERRQHVDGKTYSILRMVSDYLAVCSLAWIVDSLCCIFFSLQAVCL